MPDIAATTVISNCDFEHWPRSGGVSIRIAHIRPPEPRITVALVHGRSEFVEKWTEVINELTAVGAEVFTFDWRGQGLSTRSLPNRHKGHIDDFDVLVGDLTDWFGEIVAPRRAATEQLVVLAHSMGAHLVLRTLAERPLADQARPDAVVAMSPMLAVHLPAPGPVVRNLARLLAATPAAEQFVSERERTADRYHFEGNQLTHDRGRFEVVRSLMRANPRLPVGGPTWGWLSAAFESMRAGETTISRLSVPTLALLGADDRVVDNDKIEAIVRSASAVKTATVAHAMHEILLERDATRADAWRRIDAFLLANGLAEFGIGR